MSRAPPFPTRQNRSASVSKKNITSPTESVSIRPLQISRPTTPSSNSYASDSTRGPSRPQRSELRSRNSETDRNSISSNSTASRTVRTSPTGPRQPQRQRTGDSEFNDDATSPTLNTVLSAFQVAGTRRRAMTNGSDDFEYQRMREEERAAEMARQQQYQKRMAGKRGPARPRPGDIDAVLNQVKDGWEFVVDPDFNPVDLAVDLLDQRSTGKNMASFQDTKYKLFSALKGTVDKYYQAFAASLPHHASLLNHLSETQSQIDEARISLQESKEALGSKRADLVQMWSRGQTLEEMMRLLDQIEHLKTVPDLLETLMSEKRLLQASVLLVRNLKIINKPDMQEIGAVSDLRSYLLGQETALREILVDELHSHLFLKSFWCDSRWASYTPNQRTFPKVEFEDEPHTALPDQSPSSPSFPTTRLARFLQDLTLRPNDAPMDANESNANVSSRIQTLLNPEADSFAYLETVLESLAVLGRLGATLDIVAQRLPSEIYSLIETTIDEVSERAEYGRRSSIFGLSTHKSEGVYVFSSDPLLVVQHKNGYFPGSSLRLAALESSAQQVDQEILRDFFWTLYSKMDAVAQGLRVLYEVANRIGSRRDFKDSAGTKPGTLFPLVDTWISIQAEMKTLVYDYLTNEDEGVMSGRNPIASINEILREGRFSIRDRTKSVFRFADTDAKLTNKVLRSHEDELTQILKDTMPGLVQGPAENTVQSALSTVGTDDRLLGAGQHHRLLIKPNAFHVSVLFEPTLAFLDRVRSVLPSDIESVRESGTVLDEFVLNIYLPQLEDKVSYLFHQAISGPEAFQPDPLSKRISSEPLMKGSTHLMALINSLCAMLQMTPFHRESYSRLILGVVIQFYQRCSDKFQDLVSSSASDDLLQAQVALAAQWAQRTELMPCLTGLQNTPEENAPQRQQLWRQETHLEQDFLGQRQMTSTDLIPSIRNLVSLAGMYHSITWFGLELSALKAHREDGPLSPQNLEPLSAASMNHTPLVAYLPIASPTDQLNIILSKEMSLRFQALLRTYEQLSELILHTIRVDVRCRTVYYLGLAMKGNYSIDGEAGEPDPHIIDLNNDLSECDDLISPSVSPSARCFIFSGLGQLMEHALINGARYLRRPNVFGIRKILRNILALQQSVKTLSVNSNENFDRAKRYFSLFFLSPTANGIKQHQEYSFDDYQTMLALQCGVDPNPSDPRQSMATQATNRNYSMYVIDLHGLEIEQN
ncbi:Sec8 exocyst complex component-specific domain-containing protein [Lentinula aciculospora]|uniref:Exocyst complex component Sec8 n=1 Tax=Lentinula aciculospora TaxID=153920 RepID=A0A9W9AQD8_9AGAR|nr:Sec8 exocyst complex component-specific domain-containing protein [Lentinula aciculospora]